MKHHKKIFLFAIFFASLLVTFISESNLYPMKINKAVIPAAGLGTRFLPYTKAIPKEMLPIMEKPSIQLIIEECIASGIHECTIIANDNKPELREHFSHQPALESHLETVGKSDFLTSINTVIDEAHFVFIAQEKPLGLGHAVLQAKNVIGQEYFAVLLPDEIMVSPTPATAQLIAIAQKYNASVIGVQEVPRDKVSSYGIIAIKNELEKGVFEIERLVEKPAQEKAPSNLAISGRYILSPKIFQSLEHTAPGAGNEIQLTDGISHLMNTGERVIACIVDAQRYDVGQPLGWLQANNAIALQHKTFGPLMKQFYDNMLGSNQLENQ
jgi:UTP--glucose-1-phosphate uridylyltransferase